MDSLKDVLKKCDIESKKRKNKELRLRRLANVGISHQNVISSKTFEHNGSEPLYKLRARRPANGSYRFSDYDNMINEAISVSH